MSVSRDGEEIPIDEDTDSCSSNVETNDSVSY